MLETAITTFFTSLVLFVVMAVLVAVEQVRGRRVFLGVLRSKLDLRVDVLHIWIFETWSHFTQYIVRLGWYYSVHSLLRTVLRILVSVYTYFEVMFEKNRAKTKQLRMERRHRLTQSHLSKIAVHKAETALSHEDKVKMRKDKLENDH